MNEITNSSKDNEISIDLKIFFSTFKDRKLSVSFIILFFLVLSLLYISNAKYVYKSEAIVQVVDESQSSNLSSYSNLASLAGISIPVNETNKTMYVIETIQSRQFLKHILDNYDILHKITAEKSFNKSTKKINYDNDLYLAEKNIWRVDDSNKPSYIEAHKNYIDEHLEISRNIESGFISISITHVSPLFAYEFLNIIIKEINSISREKDIVETKEAISYLEDKLQKNTITSVSGSLSNLIESKINTLMIAEITDDYMLQEIDEPYIPEHFSNLPIFIIILISLALGLLSSFAYIFLLVYFENLKAIKEI